MNSSFRTKFNKLLDATTLSRVQREIIKSRYVSMVVHSERDYRNTCIAYVVLTNVITIAGVFIAALNPLGKLNWMDQTGERAIFWVVWGLAIALTLANKWIHTFNIPKKYVLNHIALEKFYSEGWAFLSGINKYSSCANMDERFILFCDRIEKIKLKVLEQSPGMGDNGEAHDIITAGPMDNADGTPDEHLQDTPSHTSKLISKLSALVRSDHKNTKNSARGIPEVKNQDVKISIDESPVKKKLSTGNENVSPRVPPDGGDMPPTLDIRQSILYPNDNIMTSRMASPSPTRNTRPAVDDITITITQ